MSTDHESPTFADLGVLPELARALSARGITRAFPIQAASLPDSLAGRDVLGRGRTGSGKTVAFALPILQRLLDLPGRRRPGHPRALVLVPTRELAVQVAETLDHLAATVRLKTMTVFGGVRYTNQLRRLERGVDVVIATPGRLEDLIEQGALAMDDVTCVVLDEADLMADMGFLPPVTRILERVPSGQRMLFSATLDGDVQEVVDRFLTDPLVHDVDAGRATPDVTHHLFLITMGNKRQVLNELVTDAGRTLLFARTKTFAERLARELTEAGVRATELHGNLRQAARQRNLAAFADGSVQVLVATDIAARGLHVDGVGLVVHVDPPSDPKAFLHRSGRTARAGAEGTVVTLATKQQNKYVRGLMAQAKILPVETLVAPGDPMIAQVRAPKVEGMVVAGASMFEPDPEDAVEEHRQPAPRQRGPHPSREARGPRTGWGHRDQRPEREWRGKGPAWRDTTDADLGARRRADAWASLDGIDEPERTEGRGGQRRPERTEGRGGQRRPERTEGRGGQRRPERFERGDRTQRTERFERADGPSRTGRGDRVERPSGRAVSAPVTGGKKKRWTAEDRKRRDRTDAWLADAGLGRGRKVSKLVKAGKPGRPGKVAGRSGKPGPVGKAAPRAAKRRPAR